VVRLVAPLNKELGEELKEKYAKEVEHYEGDKVDVSKEAKNLEEERDLTVRQADRFDGGEGLLEIGLVICSIALDQTKGILVRRHAYRCFGRRPGGECILASLS